MSTDLLTSQRQWTTPCRIGVVADTHVHARPGGKEVSPFVFDLFRRAEVDLLVHLGDANTRSVLEEFADVAPLLAVVGNGDDDDLQYDLPETIRFMVGQWKIAAMHGHGGRSARQYAGQRFRGKVDLVLFGHSHKPLIEASGGTTFFNPGSATDRRWFDHFGVGIITVTDERIDPELILYLDPSHLTNIDVSKGAP